MNLKKTLFTALIAMFCMSASAQEQEPKTEYVFNPHWYIQLQAGAQYTLGEVSFKNLCSPNVQAAVGYQFDKLWGTRLVFNAWQSKGGSHMNGKSYHWKWNYVAPMADITLDLTNLFGGFNPKRPVSFGIFAGIGMNIGFKNDEAWDVLAAMQGDARANLPADIVAAQYTNPARYNAYIANLNNSLAGNDQYLRLIWDDTKVRFLGHFGANLDFRLSDRVKLGLELAANTLPDAYNSKKAGNADWYFNGLLGVKINLGKAYKTRVIEAEPVKEPEPKVIERIIEKVVDRPETAAVETVEPLRRDIFFVIRGTKISNEEMQKVRDIAEYMTKYPQSRVNVTGYADKGTGNPTINRNLSMKRANVVAETLKNTFGIAASRISVDYKGDTEQPFAEQVKNRVSICIAQ